MLDPTPLVHALIRARGPVPESITTDRPATLPSLWLRCFRNGGGFETLVTERPLYGLEAYAVDANGEPDEPAAFALLNRARAALQSLRFQPTGVLFSPSEVGGPAKFPDPDSNHARAIAAWSVRVRL